MSGLKKQLLACLRQLRVHLSNEASIYQDGVHQHASVELASSLSEHRISFQVKSLHIDVVRVFL